MNTLTPPTFDAPAPKKSHKKRNIVIGSIAGLAIIGAMASACSKPADTTTPATTPAVVDTAVVDTATEAEATVVESTVVDSTVVESTVVDSTVVESTVVDSAPGAAAEVSSLTVESGFTTRVNSIGSQETTSGAMVNNGSGESACGVQVQFNLLDAGGAPIDTATETIDFILAGQRAVVAPSFLGFDKGEPASLNVSVVKVDDFIDGTGVGDCGGFSMLNSMPVEVVAPVINRDGGFSSIQGQLTNTGDELVEFAFLDCVYRAAGVIVGGESSGTSDPIPPGQSVAFSAGFGGAPDSADSVECQAVA